MTKETDEWHRKCIESYLFHHYFIWEENSFPQRLQAIIDTSIALNSQRKQVQLNISAKVHGIISYYVPISVTNRMCESNQFMLATGIYNFQYTWLINRTKHLLPMLVLLHLSVCDCAKINNKIKYSFIIQSF